MDLRELALNNNPVRHPWELARIKVIKQLLKDFIPEMKKQDSCILDMGCGDIFLIENISEDYQEATFLGVDIEFNKEVLDILENRIGNKNIKVFNSQKGVQEIRNKPVDVVFLFDVIEHIEDEITFLKELNNSPLIDENTKYVITVPAFQSLFMQHDHFLGHFRRYTNKTLKSRLEKAGMTVSRTGYFFFSLIIYRTLELLKEKLSKKKEAQGIGNWDKGKVLSKLMYTILIIDYKLFRLVSKIGLKIPGLSNYAICQKSA